MRLEVAEVEQTVTASKRNLAVMEVVQRQEEAVAGEVAEVM